MMRPRTVPKMRTLRKTSLILIWMKTMVCRRRRMSSKLALMRAVMESATRPTRRCKTMMGMRSVKTKVVLQPPRAVLMTCLLQTQSRVQVHLTMDIPKCTEWQQLGEHGPHLQRLPPLIGCGINRHPAKSFWSCRYPGFPIKTACWTTAGKSPLKCLILCMRHVIKLHIDTKPGDVDSWHAQLHDLNQIASAPS